MRFLKNAPSTTSTRSEFYFDRKPEYAGKWEAFKKYLFDWDEGTACNRSATSWCLLLVFYFAFIFIFYGIFFLMLFATTTGIDYFTNGTLHQVPERHPHIH